MKINDIFKRKPSCRFKIYKEKGILINSDCVKRNGMELIKDQSIDLILCDLPYGVTSLVWDYPIDLKLLWRQYKRILKPKGVVVLTATQPFASTLIQSNKSWFKYEWIWIKNRPTGFVHAKNKPMRRHENILVFSPGTSVHKNQSDNRMVYNPQNVVKCIRKACNYGEKGKGRALAGVHKGSFRNVYYKQEYTNYPDSILIFNYDEDKSHPTQKPVSLFVYLIKTYSDEGGVVLDNTAGYATSAISCIRTDRKFICIEKSKKWFKKSHRRITKNIELEARKAWWNKR